MRAQTLMWAFIPWPSFWSLSGPFVKDHSVIRFGLSSTKDCAKVDKVYTGIVAIDPETQKRGLSERHTLMSDAEAMVFLNPMPRQVSFWMFRTFIPLNLVFYDSEGKMRQVHSMTVEKDPSHPLAKYPSSVKVQVAVEMKMGAHEPLWSRPYFCVELSGSDG